MKVKRESEVAQSCPTLGDPMDCSLPGSSVHGFSRQEYWSGVPSPIALPTNYCGSKEEILLPLPLGQRKYHRNSSIFNHSENTPLKMKFGVSCKSLHGLLEWTEPAFQIHSQTAVSGKYMRTMNFSRAYRKACTLKKTKSQRLYGIQFFNYKIKIIIA